MRSKFTFKKDYNHVIREPVYAEVAYKAGQEVVIPKDHAEAAIAAKAGDYSDATESKKAKDKE